MRKVVDIEKIKKDIEELENWEINDLASYLIDKHYEFFNEYFSEETNVEEFVTEHKDEIIRQFSNDQDTIDILKEIDDDEVIEYVANQFVVRELLRRYEYCESEDEVFDQVIKYYGGVESVIKKLIERRPTEFTKFIIDKLT